MEGRVRTSDFMTLIEAVSQTINGAEFVYSAEIIG